MDDFIKEDMEEALQAIASMIYRAEKAKEKFAQGTSQHTLQTNRINALNIASALLAKELPVSPAACDASKEDLEKANIIESDTEPLEEENTTSKEFIEEDVKTLENVQNKARNGIEIKSRKKSEILKVKGNNYNYTVIKTQDNLNSFVEVIREDGVRYTSLEELQAIREKAIEEINKEFEEGKEI